MGLYFLETGANQRPSRVVYDRAGSALSLAGPGDVDWDRVLRDVGWLHMTGITFNSCSNSSCHKPKGGRIYSTCFPVIAQIASSVSVISFFASSSDILVIST